MNSTASPCFSLLSEEIFSPQAVYRKNKRSCTLNPRDRITAQEIKKAWKLVVGASEKVWWSLTSGSDWKLSDLLVAYLFPPECEVPERSPVSFSASCLYCLEQFL